MTTTEPKSDVRTCEFCGDDFNRKSLKRHQERKHAGEKVQEQETAPTVTGVFLANGQTYTGVPLELVAQDFKRGPWDYYLIQTEDGDKIVLQVERATP